jgi:F-type H+-transporting ATPase subunit delta
VAAPISSAQLEKLEGILAKSYGHSLKLNVEVDPAILGGIKVQVAGEILDGSLSSRLTAAKLQLA